MRAQLVLLRHGQSTWNLENRFTGWTDVPLTERGVAEAQRAAELLCERGLQFDLAFTSVLRRAIQTLWIVLDQTGQMWLPEIKDWRLNERHYGDLQGHSKDEMAARLGHQQVFDWRRGYRVRPPALRWNDPRHPRFNPRYAAIDPARLPAAESLHDTLERMLPCWQQAIVPELRAGRQVLIVAHHNSLRALVQYLDGLSETQIALLNIPTGYPLVYDLDEAQRPIRREYLGHPADVKAAADSVYRIPASIRRKLSGGEPPSA